MKIDMHQPILDKNDTLAAELRARFAQNLRGLKRFEDGVLGVHLDEPTPTVSS